jgi:glycoprotein 3-alpha-L-fucosyltransferase
MRMSSPLKRYYVTFLSIILTSLVVYSFLWPFKFTYFDISLTQTNRSKTILMWSKVPYFRKSYFHNCKYKCVATYNQNKISKADAVIFWGWHLTRLPKYRHRNQRWIFLLNESPIHTKLRKPLFSSYKFNGLFNWTVTYKHDSDIRIRFWKFSKRQRISNATAIDYASTKKKFALAVISNCANEERLKLIREMQLYLPGKIDLYGKCGDCVVNGGDNCKFKFRDYKFYLSFENSKYCKDYITEKFYANALMHECVPVVYGPRKIDYLNNLPNIPSNSFIHVDDFANVKNLVDYLSHLDANSIKYNQCHEWREELELTQNKKHHYCDICEKLHTDKSNKIYHNFEEWFNTCENFQV